MTQKPASESRRKALKSIALTPVLFSGMGLSAACRQSGRPGNLPESLYEHFLNPPAGSAPFFRWWWNGNRISREEISRELELMQAAGAGGVEVNPVEMPEQVVDPGGPGLVWLSDEWIDLLAHTIEEARRLGMQTDLIVGTGWPFGGEFLGPDETIQGVKIHATDLQGPMDGYRLRLPSAEGAGRMRILDVVLWPAGATTSGAERRIGGGFEPGTEVRIEVPEGKHRCYVLYWQDRFRTVMHGAPGGAGPVLDHFNRTAVEKYLNRMSDRIAPRLGGSLGMGLRAMFCDSIELEGANWTGDLPDEFQERVGYDLLPWLPLVLDPAPLAGDALAGQVQRVRFDYAEVLAALFAERFIRPFHEWCRAQGVLSRYQAYGHPWLYTDLIDGYSIPDIPEGDQWLFNDGWQPYADVDRIRYAIWNKYAASAGNISGRKVVSTEAMTNTSGVFRASLEYIKQAGDLNLATGINHQVLHGFNYSPPEAGFPGWIRYGCYFSEHNPWWPHFPLWSVYTARISAVLQATAPAGDLALLGPTADIWSRSGLDRNPFNLEPWYLHALWQAFIHCGFSTDYLNARLLTGATFHGGRIHCGAMNYSALLVCDVERLEPAAARRIAELCAEGAVIIFLGPLPDSAPGLRDAGTRDAETRRWMQEALKAGAVVRESPPAHLQESRQALCDWACSLMRGQGVQSGLRIEPADPAVFHHRRKAEGEAVVFLANSDRSRRVDLTLHFGENPDALWRWDAETGTRVQLPLKGSSAAELRLEPLESALLVSGRAGGEAEAAVEPPDFSKELVLEADGPWRLELQPVHGEVRELQLMQLADLGRLDETAGFSGVVHYRNTITTPRIGAGARLDLGIVGDVAELWVDGLRLGLRWWGNKTFELPAGLEAGEHRVEVIVTTTLINAMLKRADDPVAVHWIERSRDREPAVSGLVGPLKLCW
jgi:hypothetical protein